MKKLVGSELREVYEQEFILSMSNGSEISTTVKSREYGQYWDYMTVSPKLRLKYLIQDKTCYKNINLGEVVKFTEGDKTLLKKYRIDYFDHVVFGITTHSSIEKVEINED